MHERSLVVSFCREEKETFGLRIFPLSQLYGPSPDSRMLLPHRMDFFFLLLVTEGEGRHLVNGVWTIVSKGSLVVLSLGDVHAFSPRPQFQGKIVVFTRQAYRQICDAISGSRLLMDSVFGSGSHFRFAPEDTEELSTRIDVVSKLGFRATGPFDLLRFQSELLLLLFRIRSLCLRFPSAESGEVRKTDFLLFLELLEQNFKTEHEVEFYARELRLTPRSLQRVLNRNLGRSPKGLIIERILTEAKNLLRGSSLSVKEIAGMLGFSMPANFSRLFSHVVGMTPQEFRNEEVSSS